PAVLDAQIVAKGQQLKVTTANAVATFQGPDLAGFKNMLTGESYLRFPPSSPSMNLESLAPTDQSMQPSKWIASTESGESIATIILKDATRSATLVVRVDSRTQEIVIKLSGHTTVAGLSGGYWAISGLDLDGGQLVVPASTGIVFDKKHPGVGAR